MKAIRVAIVDDEPDVCDLLANMLSRDSRIEIVGIGNNGEDAIAIAAAERPDLITLDIDMPVMDGLHATRKIMERAPTRILIVTGLPVGEGSEMAYLALSAGALDILEKPIRSARWLREYVRALAAEPFSLHHTTRLNPPSVGPHARTTP